MNYLCAFLIYCGLLILASSVDDVAKAVESRKCEATK